MSNKGRSGINRPFSWLKKTLEITEKTTAPDSLKPDVQSIIDVFGWERLVQEQFELETAAAPATAVATDPVPGDTLRIVYGASLVHTDTAVNHDAWLLKRRNPGPFDTGIPTDRSMIQVGEHCSMQNMIFLIEGDFIIGEIFLAQTVGNLTLAVNFVDVPIGEYIPPL